MDKKGLNLRPFFIIKYIFKLILYISYDKGSQLETLYQSTQGVSS